MNLRLFLARTLLVYISLFFVVFLPAQGVDGALLGAVTDASGAAVPNAQIGVDNVSTGIHYSLMADQWGQYRLNHLPVGAYDVTANATNFAAGQMKGVAVQLNRTATVNLQLAVATQSSIVQVTAAAISVDTTGIQLQTSFSGTAFVDAAAAATGSGFLNLSLLAPGVASSGGLGLGVGPSIGGQRPSGNRFFIEGADNNSYFVPGPLGSVSNEAIAEFTVLQNHYSSEFGGAVGGVFNAVVKSGGNQLHGSLYEYLQNRNLSAVDAQSARQGVKSAPRFDSNRLGGTVGGPLVKNKIFYFGNYEYNPVGFATSPASTVYAPTAAAYQALAGLAGVSKTNLGVLQQYLPAAPVAGSTTTVLGNAVPIGPLSIVSPSYANTARAVGNVDWNINDRDQIRTRYTYSRFTGIDSSSSLPVFFTKVPSNTHLLSLSEYHVFSPTAQNEFRVAYSHNNSRRTAGDFTFPGLDAFPTIGIENDLGLFRLGPNENSPNGQVQGELQAADHFTWTRGRHTLRAGYDFRDVILTSSFVSNPRGYYRYSNLDTYLRDLSPNVSGTRFLGTTGALVSGMPAGFLQNAAYAQDEIRWRPNLTVNLGLRYEYVAVPLLARAQRLSSIADVAGGLTFHEPQPSGKDWSPRIGFAYSPGKNGLWVIRGGFSRAFDMPYANIAFNTAPLFYGTSRSVTSSTANFLANGGLKDPAGILSTTAAARAATSGFYPDQNRPYALNYTVSVQRRFGQDYVLEARYLGSRGVHLYMQTQLNRPAAVTATRNLPTYLVKPDAVALAALPLTLGDLRAVQTANLALSPFAQAITAYEPRGNSQYHGLSLQVTKRFSKHFSYQAAYTWSHVMDDSTATTNTTLLSPRRPQDYGDLRNEWATSMLDRRHRLVLSPTYTMHALARGNWLLRQGVGNWVLGYTMTYESPEYATVQSNVDSNLNGGDTAGDRSIINTSGNANTGSGVTGIDRNGNALSAGTNGIVAYLANNPNARYIVAGLGAFPNAGRNTFRLAPIHNYDASIRKVFNIGETRRLEIGAQAYNLFNHPQFTPGYVNDVFPTRNASRNFLIPNNADFSVYQKTFTSNSRYLQIVARFTF